MRSTEGGGGIGVFWKSPVAAERMALQEVRRGSEGRYASRLRPDDELLEEPEFRLCSSGLTEDEEPEPRLWLSDCR